MIVTLIVICEVGFWVLLAAGLGLRYLAKMPRTGAALLLCEPLLEVVLLVVTVLDLRAGAAPDWKHGLAALYIGYTLAFGHYTVRWLDGHARHRLERPEATRQGYRGRLHLLRPARHPGRDQHGLGRADGRHRHPRSAGAGIDGIARVVS